MVGVILSFRLQWGVPNKHRVSAAKLIYDTFERKFRYTFGPRHKGVLLIAHSLRSEYGLIVLREDELVGICGAKDSKGELIQVQWNSWLRTYHFRVLKTMMIGSLLWFRRAQPTVLWIDTLSVAKSARSQGIGTQIIQEFIRIGKERGYTAVKLEVINSNIRAKMLYSRLGFDITHYTNVPRPWSHLLGFTGVYQMTHSLI